MESKKIFSVFFIILQFQFLSSRQLKNIIRVRNLEVFNHLRAGSISVRDDIHIDGKITSSKTSVGNVFGTSSATDNSLVRFDGNSGKKIKSSGVTVDDSNNITGSNAISTQEVNLTNSSNYLNLKASDNLAQNYTLSFPRDPPAINQTLTSGQTDASKLEWLSLASMALPSSTSTIYVSKVGNDLSGNGSSNKPYATVSKAVSIANVLASSSAPVVIKIGTGIFTEDNSENPITISSKGISIIGYSVIGTFIVPSSLTNNLFDLTVPGIEFANLTIDAGASGSTASGIYFSSNAPGTVRIQSVTAYRFLTAVEINGGGVPIVLVEDFQARGNATSVAVSNARLLIKNSIFLGPFTGTTQANIGITVTGSSSLVTILSNSFRLMETAASNSGSADLRIIGATVEASTNGVVCSGASETQLIGVGFTINNSSSVNVSASGAGTEVVADGCLIDGHSTANESAGTGILVQNAAKVGVFGSAIKKTDVAIRCGQSSDTSTTTVIASSLSIEDSGTWYILQKGS